MGTIGTVLVSLHETPMIRIIMKGLPTAASYHCLRGRGCWRVPITPKRTLPGTLGSQPRPTPRSGLGWFNANLINEEAQPIAPSVVLLGTVQYSLDSLTGGSSWFKEPKWMGW